VSTEAAEIQCANPECRVSQTGKCVEGLALDKCPHIARAAAGAQVVVADDKVETADSTPDIPLAKSERLILDEASAVMRAAPTRVVAIIGPTSSGKTSLIASLCDLFQLGKVGELHFARSRTLFAFEQACHHARAVSRRNSPQTEHTSLASGLGFYHLGVRDGATSKILHLLFADRSGEDYRTVADDPNVAGEFVEVRRADVVTALVNGELLLDLSARHNVRHEIVMILQGLLNGDVLSANQRLAVVLTKLDVIRNAPTADRDRTERDFDGLVRQIETIFAPVFQEIRPFKIAASPATTTLPHGFGVSELLRFWAEPVVLPSSVQSLMPKAARAMGRFGMFDSGSAA
jgi:hypothetical protein